jgi:hypothetical protein
MRKKILSAAIIFGVVALLMAFPAFAQLPGTEIHPNPI